MSTTELAESPGFRIIELRAENFQRLTAVDITPDGTVQVVEGRNAQGKSSVLDAIFYALAGGNAQRGKPEIIHQGARKARVRVTLHDGTQTAIVERTWTANGTPGTLKLTDEHGTPYARPRDILDSLINERCFDPLAFANDDPKAQRERLLSIVDLPFDPDELARQRQAIFDQRSDANREVKRLGAVVDTMPIIPATVPDEEQSSAKLAEQFADAQAQSAKAGDVVRRLVEAEANVERLTAQLRAATDLVAHLRAMDAELPPLPDLDTLRQQLADVDTVNTQVRAKHQRQAAVADLDNARTTAESLTAQLEEIDARKAKALAEATMPLDGLGFDEDGVTYRGVPFSQASGAERLRVSAAMAIAANPTVRTMIVKDGPLLDDDGMELLRQIAQANDFQVFVERVWSGGERSGILIEDGTVADEAPTGPVPADGLSWLDGAAS